jgi:hypothetical protein
MNAIPERYRLELSRKLKRTEALETVSAPFGDVLVLMGGIGTGKTLAACWWATEFRAAQFMTAAELARWPRYDMAAMDRLLKAPGIVVDDLGTEYMDDKGNFLAVFDEFVNTRCANMRKTVITTNLTPADFGKRYGARITDRIVECGRFISVGGDSLRGPANQVGAEAARADEEARASAARATEKRTCDLHLYGAGQGRACDERCPSWGVRLTNPADVRAALRDLAHAKSIEGAAARAGEAAMALEVPEHMKP